MAATRQRFDLFCRIVDNYGDAGVMLRLARQLAAEHEADVTLWIDDRVSLARIAPGLDPAVAEQLHAGVRVRALAQPFAARFTLPDVVVEGFGCGLPQRYLDAMRAAARAPLWVVLEYLSAEAWVAGAHGLPSPHPRLGLARWFFFPGFVAATGGLLRERGLLAARDALRADPEAQREVWRALGIDAPPPSSLAVSLFCYPNAALPALLDAWSEGESAVHCIVAEGTATAALDAWTGGAVPHRGTTLQRGALTLVTVPFVGQEAYDRRLWVCDLDFVRGEDSFLRAQWAARPFVWHIYPQAADAHRAKLEAFLDRFAAGLAPQAAAALGRFWSAWNAGDGEATAAAWPALRLALPDLRAHGERWAATLARMPDLAENLVDFARKRL